jgi:nucleotide-binding universal stress UspA family protein
MSKIKHILVATDGSEGSLAAAAHAGELARAFDARVTVLYVLSEDLVMPHAWAPSGFPDTAPFGAMNIEEIRSLLEDRVNANELPNTAEKLGELDAEPTLVASWGHPAHEICRYAEEEGADLIVVGSHGRSALGRAFLGSVSHAVVNHAHCPVTIVR